MGEYFKHHNNLNNVQQSLGVGFVKKKKVKLKEWTAAQTGRGAIKRKVVKKGKVAHRARVREMRRQNRGSFEEEADGNRGPNPEK